MSSGEESLVGKCQVGKSLVWKSLVGKSPVTGVSIAFAAADEGGS